MTSESQDNPIRSLLVEDNPGDARLTQEALSESAYPNELDVAEDGEGAMARLLRQGEFAEAPLPDLIFLDLNLPKKDGFQVMREIREQPHLRHIPVMILTSSQAQEDMLVSYGLAVRSYIRKPLETEPVRHDSEGTRAPARHPHRGRRSLEGHGTQRGRRA